MDRSGLWKGLLVIGILLSLVAFILGWIGFGVPDWHVFQRSTSSPVEYYGLWAYCQQQGNTFTITCQRWPTAEVQLFNGSRPNFVRAAEGLITSGMILLTFGLIAAIIATILPLVGFLAGGLAFIAFICLVIGLPIFGRQSNSLSATRGDAIYYKRYGFWLIVPTIVLEFLAALLFLGAAFLYKLSGFGNIMSGSANTPYGNRQILGPANRLNVPGPLGIPYGARPPIIGAGGMTGPLIPYGGAGGIVPTPYLPPVTADQAAPSLLSEYLAQSILSGQTPIVIIPVVGSTLPQPSIVPAMSAEPVANVTPAYIRADNLVGTGSQPIINLTGETLVGPLMRTA